MTPELKGVLLGLANSFVVALAITLHLGPPSGCGHTQGHHVMEGALLAIQLGLIGGIPGSIIGVITGVAAKRIQRRRVLWLVAVPCLALALLVFGILFVLGNAKEFREGLVEVAPLLALSCIPTAAAALLLERWTRVEPEQVTAVARALR
jgi:hypothetical protein